MNSLLIANRGEVAIRIARAAAVLGIQSVAVFAEDDGRSLHVKRADRAVPLPGCGPAAYLDIEAVVRVAAENGCDAIHPGYGFLSESAAFARACESRGITFVGPTSETLSELGDKARAREFAKAQGILIAPGTAGGLASVDAEKFLASLGPDGAMVLKAVAGGGGRGMRVVRAGEDVAAALSRCQSEALAAFGCGDVYAEALLERVRHVEVQVLGDGKTVTHFGHRECSLQRRNQKLIEIGPSPAVSAELAERLDAAALRLAGALRYSSLGTFEFLVFDSSQGAATEFVFMEANPRLQVEHPVTEMITGVDLVRAQLQVASGRSLAELGLSDPVPTRGIAIELRVNAETIQPDGTARPTSGTITAFEPPTGPDVRVDTCGYVGDSPHLGFDSLLAKVIVYAKSGSHDELLTKASRALSEFRVEGIDTNISFLQAVLHDADVRRHAIHTRFIDEHLPRLLSDEACQPRRFFAGAMEASNPAAKRTVTPAGLDAVRAPMRGTIVALGVTAGDTVARGQNIAVLEAMKMEHVVTAEQGGVVREVLVSIGQTVGDGEPLVWIEPTGSSDSVTADEAAVDLDYIRPDLQKVRERHAFGDDSTRPEAVAKRRAKGQRTARENLADLVDKDSFIEYGALAIAAQRTRRSEEDLIKSTPADGILTGIASVNGSHFGADKARAMVIVCDYSVLAGTQGYFHHRKLDRAVELAERWRLPVIVLPEGGGGRPGDTDPPKVSGLTTRSFANFARLSGLVPIVSMVSGYCFAGSAVLPGCSDVIIATRNSSIGMAGPAMIEGGGLGVFAPEVIGPIDVQSSNGVVDVVVDDEQQGCRVARQYLAYFQGPLPEWSCIDQRRLRHLVPENRIRSYDVRPVIEALIDEGTLLELRRSFGVGMITALARIEGRPIGLIANNPRHLAGAIDADAADKASRFMQLCDAFALPIVSLCDTPGFMVGPEAEKTALVRHVSRMFVTAASLRVPFLTVVVRKAYGLGAQAMAGGSIHESMFSVAWPSGEFGPMGLEGAVRLGFRKELEAIADPKERDAKFAELVERMYERGKATNVASYFEIDAVIDPADTRRWIMRAIDSLPPDSRSDRRRNCIDTW